VCSFLSRLILCIVDEQEAYALFWYVQAAGTSLFYAVGIAGIGTNSSTMSAWNVKTLKTHLKPTVGLATHGGRTVIINRIFILHIIVVTRWRRLSCIIHCMQHNNIITRRTMYVRIGIILTWPPHRYTARFRSVRSK